MILIFILSFFGLSVSKVHCENCVTEQRISELEEDFRSRFEMLENENTELRKKLQNFESKLEQYTNLLENVYQEKFKNQIKNRMAIPLMKDRNYIQEHKEGFDSKMVDFSSVEDDVSIIKNEQKARLHVDTGYQHDRKPPDSSIYTDTVHEDAYEMSDTDTNTDVAMVNKSGAHVNSFSSTKTQQMKRQTSENVAFHAYISGNRCYGSHETFIFDVEVVDYGGGYNVHDGIFDVPTTGVYVFSLTVVPGLHSWVQAEITINGSVMGKIIADSDHSEDYHTGTATIVVHVNAGDHVSVRRAAQGHCDVIGDDHARTTFSGWLLF